MNPPVRPGFNLGSFNLHSSNKQGRSMRRRRRRKRSSRRPGHAAQRGTTLSSFRSSQLSCARKYPCCCKTFRQESVTLMQSRPRPRMLTGSRGCRTVQRGPPKGAHWSAVHPNSCHHLNFKTLLACQRLMSRRKGLFVRFWA